MGKDLVIVESPTKANTITRILGDQYKIMASIGHVRDLPKKGLGIDVENNFKPEYTSDGRGKQTIGELSKAAENADRIWLATDPDREGEAIAWHLYEALKRKTKAKSFERVTFHEITRSAIQHAFQHPGQIDMNRVNAQQARRLVDRLVGYKVSPLLWRRLDNARSAGRVQSVAVRLICEREAEIETFKAEEYWLLTAQFLKAASGEGFSARLGRIDGDKVEINNAADARRHADAAQAASYTVTKVSRTPRSKRAAPPFITSTLQQAASSNLRFSTDQTMRIAQELYEGVDTGEGASGLITYMRTDSVNVSKEAQAKARDYISETFGPDYVPEKPNNYRSRGTAQEAHEAIRPTDITLTPDKAKHHLSDRQYRLYRLIWNRFVASQMAPAKLSLHQVELTSDPGSAPHSYLFRAASTKVVFPGYMRVYNLEDVDVKDPKGKEGDDEDDDAPSTDLPELDEKDRCTLSTLDQEQKFTEPPPRFSEATLVRELERNGIGRPSTYSSIVKVIQEREYVAREKGKLIPTELGRNVNNFLVKTIPELFEVRFTARMEDTLDVIEQGELDWVDMLDKFYGNLSQWLDSAKTAGSPENADVKKVLDLFPAKVDWRPAEKRGRRTYDDQKFYTDLVERVATDKRLSPRQWNALIMMAVRYQDQLGDLDAVAAELGIVDEVAEHRAKQKEIDATYDGEPDAKALQFCGYFATVTTWEAPEKRGNRTYDDKKFYESLKEQAEQGRSLSEAQMRALKRMLVKYREQIPAFDSLQDELGEVAESVSDTGEIEVLLGLAADVKEWQDAKKGRYNDKNFYESLNRQFQQRRNLTPKQVNALKRLLGKYADQIPDFATRSAGLELPKAGEKKEVKLTDVDCPKCGKAKLAERSARGRTFFGCSRYPRCKYTNESLDKAREEAAK